MDIGGVRIKAVMLTHLHDALLQEAVGQQVALSITGPRANKNKRHTVVAISTPRGGVERPGILMLTWVAVMWIFMFFIAGTVIGVVLAVVLAFFFGAAWANCTRCGWSALGTFVICIGFQNVPCAQRLEMMLWGVVGRRTAVLPMVAFSRVALASAIHVDRSGSWAGWTVVFGKTMARMSYVSCLWSVMSPTRVSNCQWPSCMLITRPSKYQRFSARARRPMASA